MKILIVAATTKEVNENNLIDYDVLITGVGMVNTVFSLTKYLHNHTPDIIINVGIAGAYNLDYNIGDVVEVSKDCFSEIGAQSGADFLDVNVIGLDIKTDFCFKSKTSLPQAKGITVNTIHGEKISIDNIKKRLNPDVESMEGAACMMVCNNLGFEFFQIRAISNYVEERSKEKWNISLAIKNLNLELNRILDAYEN